MHLSPHEIEAYKRELTIAHLLPAFGALVTFCDAKVEDVVSRCQLQNVIRNQYLESPGAAMTGSLWFSLAAMSHSYFFNSQKRISCGTRIYKKRELIFNGDSLIHGSDRQDYIQMLEDGFVLSISFHDLLFLMDKYSDIEQAMRELTLQQGIFFRQQTTFRELSSIERVKRLKTEHAAFIACTNREVQAIHAHLSIKQYYNKIKELT